jgi:putative flippase GtrA
LWRGSKKSDDAEASGRSLHHLHHGESSDRHVEHGPSLATSVYLVTGLDRVLFGTQSCADAVTVVGIKPPRYLWFMLSGGVCDVVQFATNVLLYWSAVLRDPSLIWAAGFLISIAFRHSSHRYLVFGDYVGGYWASLTRMYAGYSVIIVLSTAFNYVAARAAGPVVPVYAIWIATMLWTGLANYFILKKLWSFDGGFATSGKATSPTVTVAQ